MKRSIGLLVLTLIIAAAALVLDIRFDRESATARVHVLVVERAHAGLATLLANLRAAQAAYVAIGQDPDFWMARTTDLAAEISAGLTRQREQAVSDDAARRYMAADTALAEFSKIDGRVRDWVRGDQKLLASDFVFMDALQQIDRIDAELAAARSAQTHAAESRVLELGRLRLAVNAAALAGLAVLVFLVRPAAAKPAEPKPAPSTLQMIKDLPPPVKKTPAPIATPSAVPVAQPAPKAPHLSAAAELCVDLAKVADAQDMPTLVQRAASVLEAKGVVLWMVDAAGATLRPLLAHGYADKIVARMGPLQVDGENVTALAFRTREPQTVTGTSPADAGAVAVPLITPAGCVGVLAAETRPNRNGTDVLPLARIIAAQFAAVVGPVQNDLAAPEPRVAVRTAQA